MANILIVDDQIDLVEMMAELLEKQGHKVKTGHGGEEGLLSMEKGVLPDCLILDVDMPGMSGPGMAHEMLLRDAGKEKIPIFLVSGREDLPDIARKMGTPYFLQKGTTGYAKDLLKILSVVLRENTAPTKA